MIIREFDDLFVFDQYLFSIIEGKKKQKRHSKKKKKITLLNESKFENPKSIEITQCTSA